MTLSKARGGHLSRLTYIVALGGLALCSPPARAQDPEPAPSAEPVPRAEPAPGTDPAKEARARQIAETLRSIKWQVGPTTVQIGSQAQLELPEGYTFTAGPGARKMLEMMKNPTDGRELGLLTDRAMSWFVVFDFSDIGYVKDADKEELDGEEILDSIKEGTEASNKERQKRGWPAIQIVGWKTAPFYNHETHNLEWAIKGRSRGHELVNYNTRILGREGVMSANLMVAPQRLEQTLPTIKQLLTGFSFVGGKSYSEYKPGDKIAKYGLAALVVGGAVGVAAKMGFLAKLLAMFGKLWKLLIVGLVALGAGIKSLFTGRRKRQAAAAPMAEGDPDAMGQPPAVGLDAAEPPEDQGPTKT